MKQQLISRLVVGALAAIAANAAFAGQIQASSVSIAREVITDDAQAITSPSISYRFNGDVDARLQDQTFQVQFNLKAGTWKSAGLAAHVKLTDGVSGDAITQGVAAGNYEVKTLSLSADKTTLFATITVHTIAAPAGLIKQPIVSIASSTTSTDNPTIIGLKTVVGDVAACDNLVKTLKVGVKHYVALSDPSILATDANATADEHTRAGATNDATLITFPTNLNVRVVKSSSNAKLDVSQNSTRFATNGNAVTQTGTVFDSYISTTVANLGSVYLVQQATGYDADLVNQYALANAGSVFIAGQATKVDGRVEAKDVKIVVTADQGFQVGSTLELNTKADGSGAPLYQKSFPDAASAGVTSTTFTVNVPADLAKLAASAGTEQGLYVIYRAAATAAVIPGTSFTVSAATIEKAPESGTAPNLFAEQNNTCNGPLYSLGGSIKIDVRNYAATARNDGWLSVLRLINTSEVRTATVYAQYIGADGKYGNWGKLTTLAPRASQNLTPDVVNAKLTNAPAAPTATDNAASSVPVATAGGDAPRLRITTSDGNTLRVQNYLYNPASKNFIEASGSQGVDFTYSNDRALTSTQNTEQDAQAGINQGN